MTQKKLLCPQSWPEALKHDHEEENNRQAMNELKVLSQHLLDYNRRTFEKFMQDGNIKSGLV